MNLSALGISLIALLCLAGIVEQWAPPLGVPLWRLGAVMLVLGLAYEWWRVRGAALETAAAEVTRLRLGRAESLDLTLTNNGSVALELEYVAALPPGFETDSRTVRVHIDPQGRCVEPIPVRATALGRHPLQRLPARVLGPLGLAWWPKALQLSAQLGVIPDVIGAPENVGGEALQGERATGYGDGLELHHLREYQRGDPPRHIHWKASARRRELVTRVFAGEQHLDIMLVLDLGRTSRTEVDGLSQFGHYVNFCARFAQFAGSHGDRVGVLAAADRQLALVPPQPSSAAVASISGALQQLEAVPVETDLLGAALRVQGTLRQRSLIILLTDLYGQSLQGSLGRSLMLWNSRHLPMVVGLMGEDVLGLPSQAAASRNETYTRLAAQEYQAVVQGIARGVERLGARAIVTRPAELQSRVFSSYRELRQQHRV